MSQDHHKETLAKIGSNNVMRHEYRALDDHEKHDMKIIKDMGLRFVEHCDKLGHSRELSLAITKMEEAVFWAVKHITRDLQGTVAQDDPKS